MQQKPNTSIPLATFFRPVDLSNFVGQSHLIGENGPIRQMIQNGNISSMIFWGPPASGKTTLAKIIATHTEAEFYELSAVMDGKEELKKVVLNAKQNQAYGKQTILFIDEIHRWNKAQQDGLLPFVESGQIILIGATTENPSFEIISALLSRSRVFVFEQHNQEDILKVLERGLGYLKSENTSNVSFRGNREILKESNQQISPVGRKDKSIEVEHEALKTLAELANGDMRFALNSLELAYNSEKLKTKSEKSSDVSFRGNREILKESNQQISPVGRKDNGKTIALTPEIIMQAVQKYIRYDKNGEEHYNIISAVHKSLRSSNASAATYWVVRMLHAGEDPLYIARRLVRFASEDIGNAAPNALVLANAVYDTCHKIGMPECKVALVQLVEYLARSPKNNSAYKALNQAEKDVVKYGNLGVPLHFRNAPTKLMKDLSYGQGYEYDHDLEGKKSTQECFPDELKGRNYFE